MTPGGAAELATRAAALAVELGAELPPRPGASGTVDVAITGTDAGDVHLGLEYLDGRIVAAQPGQPAGADLTLGLPAPDAAEVVAGRLSPSVAYMRGRLRTAGDNRLLLGVLAGSADPAFARWISAMRTAG